METKLSTSESRVAPTVVLRGAPLSFAALLLRGAIRATRRIASLGRLFAVDVAPAQPCAIMERVTVDDGVVCVAHYVHGRLVDQRRVKAAELVIERRLDRARRCVRVEMSAAGRTLEIGRHSTSEERERAIERLAANLRGLEIEPHIRTTFGELRRRAPRTGARLAARFRRLLRRRDRTSGEAPASIPPGASVRRSRPASVDASPGGDRAVASARRSRRWWIAAAAAIVLASAAVPRILPLLQPRSAEAVATRAYAPSFRLLSASGEIVDENTMLGRPYAVFFGFTHCPEVCPSTLLELTRAADDAAAASGFDILFVTLDPERDTQEVLSDYASSFRRRIIGLRGGPEEIERAARAFRVYRRKVSLPGGDYTIDHTALVYLVDRRGQLSGVVSFMERADEAAKTLKDFIRRENSAQRRRGSRHISKRRRRRARDCSRQHAACARAGLA